MIMVEEHRIVQVSRRKRSARKMVDATGKVEAV